MTPKPRAVDIAIVGGGMVGISLALLLARARPGWRIALIESFPFPQGGQSAYQPSFDARSTALAAGSAGILRRAGLWAELQAHLTAITTVHVSDRGHFGGLTLSGAEYALPALGYVAENAWLGRVLAGRLADHGNVDVIAPAAVTHLRPRRRGYELTLEREGKAAGLDATLVALADGVQSQLRTRLGIGTAVTDYGQAAIVANVRTDRPHAGVAYERFTASGPVALLPMGESPEACQSALIWTQPAAAAEARAVLPDAEFLAALQHCFGHRQGRLLAVSRRHVYPLSLTWAREQVRRGLVVVGNAAHALHPVAGQGFNLALRDCVVLAQVLTDAAAAGQPLGDLGVLQTYLDRRATDQHTTIRLSDSFVRLFSTADPAFSVLRQLGLWSLDALPPAKTAFARQTTGLG